MNFDISYFLKSPLICHPENKNKPLDIKHFKGDHLSLERSFHRQYALKNVTLDGEYLEFGVHTGGSINDIARTVKEKTIHGFDSFEGLPEDWVITKKESLKQAPVKITKGFFKLDNLPEVESNVRLWKGWFKDMIPIYVNEIKPKTIAFLHIDGDLYSSANDVLEGLNEFILKDTIILFDDFYPFGRKPYEMWEDGEYKALKEWTNKYNRSFEVLSHNLHQQTAIKILY